MKYKAYLLLSSLLLLICLPACRQTNHLTEIKVHNYRITAIPLDSAVYHIATPYRQQMEAEMNVLLGSCAQTLRLEKPEGTLNNLLGDVLYERTTHHYGPIDFALLNYGGVRISELVKGDISLGRIYELMPFDNHIVILKINGEQLQRLFNLIADYGGWPVSKEVNFRIENNKAVDVMLNGAPIDFNHTYLMSLPDYIANGGGDYAFLKAAERIDLKILVRDAIIEYVKMKTEKGEVLTAKKDGRLSF